MKYENITKYLEELEKDNIGTWIIDKKSAGTLDDPIQMPFVNYAKANYGISQADMYQMYAYNKKYQSESVTLLYPLTEKIEQNRELEFNSNDGVMIKVRFIDLFDLNKSLEKLANEITEV